MKRQSGMLHHLILPSLILLSVVVSSLGMLYTQNQQSIIIARSVDTARAQLGQIQNALSWCRVMYPSGDNGSGLGKNLNLPASPMDGSWVSVRNIVCPGDLSQNVWLASRDQLAMPGVYLAEWEYRNTVAGTHIRLSVATPGDGSGQGVLMQVAARLAPTQKNLTGDTLEIMVSN